MNCPLQADEEVTENESTSKLFKIGCKDLSCIRRNVPVLFIEFVDIKVEAAHIIRAISAFIQERSSSELELPAVIEGY